MASGRQIWMILMFTIICITLCILFYSNIFCSFVSILFYYILIMLIGTHLIIRWSILIVLFFNHVFSYLFEDELFTICYYTWWPRMYYFCKVCSYLCMRTHAKTITLYFALSTSKTITLYFALSTSKTITLYFALLCTLKTTMYNTVFCIVVYLKNYNTVFCIVYLKNYNTVFCIVVYLKNYNTVFCIVCLLNYNTCFFQCLLQKP